MNPRINFVEYQNWSSEFCNFSSALIERAVKTNFENVFSRVSVYKILAINGFIQQIADFYKVAAALKDLGDFKQLFKHLS